MSNKKMTEAWATRCDNHTDKLVLIALADNANGKGFCFPSLNYLAWKCDLTRQGLLNVIKRLAAKKLVIVQRGEARILKGKERSNHYWVLPRYWAGKGRGQ